MLRLRVQGARVKDLEIGFMVRVWGLRLLA